MLVCIGAFVQIHPGATLEFKLDFESSGVATVKMTVPGTIIEVCTVLRCAVVCCGAGQSASCLSHTRRGRVGWGGLADGDVEDSSVRQ